MQGLETFLSQFGVPETLATNRLFQAAVVVVLSILAAKIADWVISRMITRWARKTVTDLDDRILEMLHRPLFLFVLLGGLALAADLLQLEGGLQKITFGVLGTIAVFTAFSLVMRVSRLALETLG